MNDKKEKIFTIDEIVNEQTHLNTNRNSDSLNAMVKHYGEKNKYKISKRNLVNINDIIAIMRQRTIYSKKEITKMIELFLSVSLEFLIVERKNVKFHKFGEFKIKKRTGNLIRTLKDGTKQRVSDYYSIQFSIDQSIKKSLKLGDSQIIDIKELAAEKLFKEQDLRSSEQENNDNIKEEGK